MARHKRATGATSEREAGRKKRDALEKVAARFSKFRPAREVLKKVSAVPTIFPQFDHGTRVGGFPIERFALVHGPSNHGKTTFTLGLMGSFLQRGHFALFVDAERTTPMDWAQAMMGETALSPNFFALRPHSYEETVEQVRAFLLELDRARKAGEVDPDTSAIVVVDSIRKLVPKGILEKILKSTEGQKGIDGMGGRAAQIKAAMNAAWLDELTPLLEDTRAGFIAIAREAEDPDADPWAKKAGRAFKVGGGKAIYYDSSLVMRVERASFVAEKITNEDYKAGARGKVFGERHRVTIHKTKVAGKDDKQVVTYFHTSNGTMVPAGFDLPRDLVELGVTLGVIKKKGTWLMWGRVKWQGEHAAVRKLHAEPDKLALLEEEVRGAFVVKDALAHDEDGVVQ